MPFLRVINNMTIEQRNEYIKSNYPAKRTSVIAKELDVSQVTVNATIKKLGIENVFASRMKELEELKRKNQAKCRCCKQIFPRTKEYFYGNGRKFHAICKTCQKKADAKKYKKHFISLDAYANFFVSSKKATSKWRKTNQLNPQDITEQYQKQKGLCFYSGEPLEISINSPKSISVDRKNSLMGYTKENMVLCCRIINTMKSNSTIQDFKEWCRKVADYTP